MADKISQLKDALQNFCTGNSSSNWWDVVSPFELVTSEKTFNLQKRDGIIFSQQNMKLLRHILKQDPECPDAMISTIEEVDISFESVRKIVGSHRFKSHRFWEP
jgi:hypothetical protein